MLHEVISRQMEIEIIVRQQDMAQPLVVLRLVPLQPENFRRRESGQKQQPRLLQRRFVSTELLREQRTFLRCARVAP
jgi:hypothetical protein